MSAPAILDWAMQTGLSISVLILFILLVRKPVARHLGANAAYMLWSLPVIRLLLPALPVLPAKPEVLTPVVPYVFELPSVIAAPAEPIAKTIDWSVMVIGFWLSGAFIWLLVQAYRQAKFDTSIRQNSRKISGPVRENIRQIARRLGMRRLPEIRQAQNNSGPLVSGLIRPIIILPANFETGFTPEQQKHAFIHELSHVKHGDLWTSAAALIFRALNWPNPLVHLAAIHFRADQEAACDARVIALIGDDRFAKSAYADTLIRAAKLSNNPAPIPLGLTISNPLKERLMILKNNPAKHRGLQIAFAGTAALALLVTAPLTAAQTPTPPTPPDTGITAKSVDKRVMKWVTNENGVETKKHIEIITEDGVTTAWEIDEIGNRIQVPVDSLNMPMDFGSQGDGKMRVMVKKLGDGHNMSEEELEALITGAMEGLDKEELAGKAGQRRIVIKRSGDNQDIDIMSDDIMGGLSEGKRVVVMENNETFDFDTGGDNSFFFHAGDHRKFESGIIVDVASQMLDGVNTDDMDRRTRRKIEDAKKALKEAQEALAEAD